jgi:hypothetical protein
MMSLRQVLVRTFLPAILAACVAGAFATGALAHPGHLHTAGLKPLSVPPDQPDKGLVYSGLEVATDGTCRNGFKLRGSNLCTHGPDLPRPGFNVKSDVAPVTRATATPGIRCDGDGTSGKRVQVMYVRASDQPDRYATYAESIRGWAAETAAIYQDSAAETGGYRQIRFVHDSSCVLSVLNVVLSPTGDDNFTNTRADLSSLGYNLASRKYMLFVDANVYCGIGTIWSDDQPGAGNLNNVGTSYARTDAGCWGAHAAAHELMHNLGGVQLTAPNTSGGFHCTDEYDDMCYSDTPNFPAMRIVCPDTSHEFRFDCNHDDYFSTNPPGSNYLATHWNSANSGWLIATPPSAPPAFNWAANPSVDFDGDHLTDLGALYRGLSPADSLWFAPSSAGGASFQIYFAGTTDIAVPGDYNGDGKTDAVIFRPSTGLWYGPQTGAAAIVIQTIVGQAGDIPIPGDYDGDGKTDPAVYRPATGAFFAVKSSGGVLNISFGAAGDTPVPRDYDGDGKTDPAIYRPNVAAGLSLWYAILSGGGVYQIYFGNVGDIPVPGDYNGDRKAEAVIFRPDNGLWYGPFNGAPGLFQLTLGGPGDIPIPGYYDNNLTEDPAIYRNGTGLWFALNSGGSVTRVDGLGLSTDVPVEKRPTLAGGL